MSNYTVGIDLGTTNSCVAIFRDNKVDIVENDEGQRVTPSWVTFTNDVILTGLESIDEFHRHLNTTVFEAKRLIGQKFNHPKVQSDIKRFPYTVFNDLGTPKIRICLEDKPPAEYYPEEISAYILASMRRYAEQRLNAKIVRAVVTVPAYFNNAQRQATKDAAMIAGFKVVNVINEPTAAALAFDFQNRKSYKRNIVVYDFGGGTFDVSIVTVGRNKCEVRATKGDSHLGGTDIDMRLVDFIKEDFKTKFGKDISQDNDEAARRLKNACEKAKKTLSGTQYATTLELDYLVPGIEYSISISRARLEQLNEDLFDHTMRIVDECLSDSGIKEKDIDEVVLVGGSSKIPKVQELLENYFGNDKINRGVNPDEAVAFGAAIHAFFLAGDKSEVVDVTSLSLGTNTFGDVMSVIIPRNTSVPARHKKRYQTIMDNQREMTFLIYQGENEKASDNFELGDFTITDLTEAPAYGVKVDVCFEIDAEGILHVSATETNSVNTKNITIDVKKKGLTDEQIKLRIIEGEKNREMEERQRTFNKEKHNLENLLYRAKAHAELCDDDDREKIMDEYDQIYKWLEKLKIDQVERIEEKKSLLENLIETTPKV